MKKRGEITVFLALILSVISAFILLLIQHVRTYVYRSEIVCAVDNAVRSCFAEYNKELFDRFGILLIDSSYKGPEGGIDNVEDHFSMYLTESLSTGEVYEVSIYPDADDEVIIGDEEADMEYITGYMRENGSPGFDEGNCYSSLVFSATVKGGDNRIYTITRKYSYDTGT